MGEVTILTTCQKADPLSPIGFAEPLKESRQMVLGQRVRQVVVIVGQRGPASVSVVPRLEPRANDPISRSSLATPEARTTPNRRKIGGRHRLSDVERDAAISLSPRG